jgi:hypothetical protein
LQEIPAPQPDLTLDSIDKGIVLVENKKSPDPIDLLEDERVQKAKLENELSQARIEDVEADRELRKTYANRILRFLEWYSGGVGGSLWLTVSISFGFTSKRKSPPPW